MNILRLKDKESIKNLLRTPSLIIGISEPLKEHPFPYLMDLYYIAERHFSKLRNNTVNYDEVFDYFENLDYKKIKEIIVDQNPDLNEFYDRYRIDLFVMRGNTSYDTYWHFYKSAMIARDWAVEFEIEWDDGDGMIIDIKDEEGNVPEYNSFENLFFNKPNHNFEDGRENDYIS